jgi:hypothetical protein
VRGASGLFACFDHSVPSPREFASWLIDHPDRLRWPPGASLTPEAERLRRALVLDDPAGSRARAQARAHELLRTSSPFNEQWWRFEAMTTPHCVLMTDRLVLTVQGSPDPLTSTNDWFPARSGLVRTLEAARQLANGRRWGTLWLADAGVADDDDAAVQAAVDAGAPHLSAAARDEMRAAYLGAVSWEAAADALAVPATRPA